MLIELPIVKKDGKQEEYTVNINNINYFRKWVGNKGELQTVMYFNGSEAKYLVVDLPKATVKELILKTAHQMIVDYEKASKDA